MFDSIHNGNIGQCNLMIQRPDHFVYTFQCPKLVWQFFKKYIQTVALKIQVVRMFISINLK